MTSKIARRRAIAMVFAATVVGITGCGRKGDLKPVDDSKKDSETKKKSE